jgi:4-hydroxy-3-methylbut-2-enyl diphosphate reductase
VTELQAKGWQVIDATCPFVKKAQELAREAKEEGYQVIILGDKEHAEVKGLRAWTDETAVVAASWHELERTALPDKVAVLAQTTEKEERFEELVSYLKEKVPVVKVIRTICPATRKRQKAAAELAPKVDLMIIIGGRHSSNTRKLLEICRSYNKNSCLIEGPEDIRPHWFKGLRSVGITAGASTPAWIIKEVIEKMEENMEQKEKNTGFDEEKVETESQDLLQPETSALDRLKEDSPAEERPEEDDTGPSEIEGGTPAPAEPYAPVMQDEIGFKSFKPGDVLKGKVVKVSADEVLVDIGGKSEGIIPAAELASRHVDPREYVSAGQEIMVEVLKEDKEGNVLLSHKKARMEEALNRLEAAQAEGSVVTAPVIEVVKGGLLVDVGIRGFVPASQVDVSFVPDLGQYLKKELRMKVLELDRKNRKAVLSQRAVLEEEQRRKKEALWAELEEGQTRKGIVRRLTDFGAFVDLGGIDGLLHVSEMGWGRVGKPSDVVKEGEELEVNIIKLDPRKQKVSLSLKGLLKSPWEAAAEKYPVGKVVEGKVVRIAPFGAFIELEPGIDGLVHISQLSTKRVAKVEDVLTTGEKVDVKVIENDPEKKRISLSLKEIVSDKEKNEYETFLERQKEGSGVTIGEILKKNNKENNKGENHKEG